MNVKIIEHTFSKKFAVKKRAVTNKIILHCEATKEGKDYTVEQVDGWHKAQKWACIGYHFVIYRDGSIHRGREENLEGTHCAGYNSTSIGISYVGGCDVNGKPKDTRTPEQKAAMYELVYMLLRKYGLTMNNIYCHNQLTQPNKPKACPSFKIETFKHEYLEYFKNKK